MGNAYRAAATAVAEFGDCIVSQLGLRFDRVAVRVVDQLAISTDACAPEGLSVILTLTAPIRTPTKVVDALRGEVATLIQKTGAGLERSLKVGSSRAEIQIVAGVWHGAPKLPGFVHNPSAEAADIVELAARWLCTLR